MSTIMANFQLIKGKEYEVVDGCGMLTWRGKYLGVVRKQDFSKELFLFEMKTDSFNNTMKKKRYGGAHIVVDMVGDGGQVRLFCSYYGANPRHLHLHSIPDTNTWSLVNE